MPTKTLTFGLSLVILGLISYFGTGQVSKTALIPAYFGAVFSLLGLLGKKEGARKHAMHVAMLLAVLALLGAARGIPGIVTLVSGGEVARPTATIAQGVMFVLSLLYLGSGIRSFRAARQARD